MKKIRNIWSEEVEIPATGQFVPANHQVEIEDDDLARSLLEQTDRWEAVKAPKKEN